MGELRIAVAGASGRMGGAVIRALGAAAGLRLAAAFDRADSSAIGRDVGGIAGLPASGVEVTADLGAALAQADAVIDFTTPAASIALARETGARGLVHVIGTTGLAAEDRAALAGAAASGARIVLSGNFSLGLNTLLGLVRQAAAALPGYDIEIVEMHHARKVDAPSGTALMLGEAAALGRGIALEAHAVRVRDGHTGPRLAGSIGFATLRGGTVVGDHSVILAGEHERIEFTHRAEDRAMFALGALRAAAWAADRPAGLYSMADVLGFTTGETK